MQWQVVHTGYFSIPLLFLQIKLSLFLNFLYFQVFHQLLFYFHHLLHHTVFSPFQDTVFPGREIQKQSLTSFPPLSNYYIIIFNCISIYLKYRFLHFNRFFILFYFLCIFNICSFFRIVCFISTFINRFLIFQTLLISFSNPQN